MRRCANGAPDSIQLSEKVENKQITAYQLAALTDCRIRSINNIPAASSTRRNVAEPIGWLQPPNLSSVVTDSVSCGCYQLHFQFQNENHYLNNSSNTRSTRTLSPSSGGRWNLLLVPRNWEESNNDQQVTSLIRSFLLDTLCLICIKMATVASCCERSVEHETQMGPFGVELIPRIASDSVILRTCVTLEGTLPPLPLLKWPPLINVRVIFLNTWNIFFYFTSGRNGFKSKQTNETRPAEFIQKI